MPRQIFRHKSNTKSTLYHRNDLLERGVILLSVSNTNNLTMEDATVESEPTMAAERVEDENGELAVGVEEEVETTAVDADADADADESTPTMTADEPVAAPATSTADDNDNNAAVEEVELPPPRIMITKMVS